MHPASTASAALLARRLLVLPLAVLAVATLLSCTSAGDGGVGETDDYLSLGGLYESDASSRSPTDPNPRVAMSQSVDQRTIFCLDVDVFRVSNLYSVAFTVAYDSGQADFRGYTVGDFLGSDLLVSVDGSSPGQVLVGLTRQFPVHGMTGVSSVGGDPGHLIELCFDVVGEDTERGVDFVPNLALEDPDGNSVGSTEWLGGVLTTRL